MGTSTPTRIGKYDIIEVLGRGGMGVVYKAKDPQLGRLVAIKMTAGVGESPELVSRFFREAQSTASLQHPNIVTVYELGDWSGNPYLVMEYLEGRSLDVIIGSKRPLNLVDELDIMLDVCCGLNYAHQRNIIHRDIKPANIVVLKSGGVKLVDFGIAHIVGRKLTLPGQVIGSFNYMSPEQINSKPIDTRTDIFSAGIVLYQLLTKALPFEAENTAATLMKIVHEPPPPLAKFLNVYPPDLEPIILRALAKDRDERYPTAEEFAVDLRRIREQVRQETVNRHLKEASALIEANALSKAKDEVFQALKWDPHHARAGQLMREIQLRMQGYPPREAPSGWGEVATHETPQAAAAEPPKTRGTGGPRPSRLEECLQEAQQEINSRRFSSALEILKEAQSLDPDAPRVKELVRSVTVARETEKRTQELNALRNEIEAAIRWEDYAGASEKASAALAKFPGDPGLLKLKELSEKQRSHAERNNLIDQELGTAQKLLEQGREEEVIALLTKAANKFGQDSRLDSLLRFVRENVERKKLEKHKNDCLLAAREQLTRKDYAAAIRTLQMARADLKDNTEIENLLRFVRDLAAAEQRRTTLAAAADRVRSLTASRAYNEAIKVLETTLSEIPDEDLEILLAQTRKEAAAHRRKLQSVLESAEKLLQEQKPDDALKMLEAENATLSNEPDWQSLVNRSRKEAEISHQVQQAITEARNLAESGQYDSARGRLAECRSRVGSRSTQLDQELVRIEQLRVAENTRKVERAVEEAKNLTGARDYESALEKLASVAKLLSEVPATLRSKYEDVQKEASQAIVQRARAEIQGYIANGQITQAQEALSRTSTNITVFKALADLESAVNDEVKRRAGAQRALEEARSMLQRNEWQQAADLLKRALVLQIRAPKLKTDIINEFFNAAEISLRAGWRPCEQLLKQFRELEPQYQIPAPLLTKLSDLRRDDAVFGCLDRAKLLQMKGDWQGARREVSHLAAIYPTDSRLTDFCQKLDLQIAQEEERARQEKAQREQESSVADAIRRADAETSLDVRASILGEAKQKYPQDARLEPRLNQLREFSRRISEMAQAAMAREEAGEYEVALAKWEALRRTYRHYPGLEQHTERLKRLRDEARGASRNKWIRKIKEEMAASDYEAASVLLSQATAEFPWDDELMAFQSNVQAAIKTRGKAQKHLEGAQEAFAKQRWDAGRKAIIKACQTAKEDRIVWEQAMKQVTDACSVSRGQEPGFAESTLRQLSELSSPFPLPTALVEQARGQRTQVSPPQREVTEPRYGESQPTAAGWMGKVRNAISSLSGTEHQQPQSTGSELETAPMVMPEVAHSQRPASANRPQAPVAESKPKVLEFPAGNEGWARDARPSATEAFMPGAVAPSFSNVVPSEPKSKTDHVEPTANPPSIVSTSLGTIPSSASQAGIPSRLDLRAGSKWPEETLREIEKRLAMIVGPLARVLVRRAAAQSTSLDELLSLLTANLPSEADRRAFLSSKSEFLAKAVATQVGSEQGDLTVNRTTLGTPNPQIDGPSMERAVVMMARYVGPISSVLVKRAATRARNVEELYLLLAERVEESQRARFLKECGFSTGS